MRHRTWILQQTFHKVEHFLGEELKTQHKFQFLLTKHRICKIRESGNFPGIGREFPGNFLDLGDVKTKLTFSELDMVEFPVSRKCLVTIPAFPENS